MMLICVSCDNFFVAESSLKLAWLCWHWCRLAWLRWRSIRRVVLTVFDRLHNLQVLLEDAMAFFFVELLGGLNLLGFRLGARFCVGNSEVDSLGCVLQVDVESLR